MNNYQGAEEARISYQMRSETLLCRQKTAPNNEGACLAPHFALFVLTLNNRCTHVSPRGKKSFNDSPVRQTTAAQLKHFFFSFVSSQAISFLTPLAVIFVVKIIQRTDKTEIKEACLGTYSSHSLEMSQICGC